MARKTATCAIRWGETSTPRLWRGTGRQGTYEINKPWSRRKHFLLNRSGDPREHTFSSLRAAKDAACRMDQRKR